MKRIGPACLSIALLIAAGLQYRATEAFNRTVNSRTVQLVTLGMPRDEVIGILGSPSWIEKGTYVYETPGLSLPKWRKLWVHLDGDLVTLVNAKEETLFDDCGVYSLSQGRAWVSPHFSHAFKE